MGCQCRRTKGTEVTFFSIGFWLSWLRCSASSGNSVADFVSSTRMPCRRSRSGVRIRGRRRVTLMLRLIACLAKTASTSGHGRPCEATGSTIPLLPYSFAIFGRNRCTSSCARPKNKRPTRSANGCKPCSQIPLGSFTEVTGGRASVRVFP